ncbi:MAG: hypothetical protein A3C81_03025 [Candidatus Yanofskybacteria bacterium RIFCSPHIGHO2_02_FULL_46_19]|uniref:Transposase IS200-like domain-containing protein n=2 Tax=Candidatus Yanofskyibacteriota TaxID=1752733 RepID=A0A1F8H2V0_9BACT|nr:MAG: hypothetical protein A3C81_03025 [Candidatus Yanofskybacteria bacterium RIFCSPHIGHO2_02_FULL_46_19]OGN31947.1 MAG: hypothetical protein A3J01_03015 [Candidatus Yanofskybacteria bacterium RIFCSPLOWO2_02_FULL_45_18]
MPRPTRTIEGDTIYHVLNRANAKMQIFEKEKDYLAFEKILLEAKDKYPMRILAYCLMPNHWHFVLYPKDKKDLPEFMRWITLTHTQRWLVHRNMVGYGHLYQGRYKSFPIQEDSHFLQVCRYVERNALRAKLVNRAEDWRWGSAWIRKRGSQEQKQLVSPWPVPMTSDYLSWLNQRDESGILINVRNAVSKGRPFGSENWIQRVVKKFKLESTLHPRGRPRKGT